MRRTVVTLASTLGVVAASCRLEPPEDKPAAPLRRPDNPILDAPIVKPPAPSPSQKRMDKMRRGENPGSFMWSKDYGEK